MSLNFCLDAVELVCSIRVRIFSFVFTNSYMNSCTNSYANSHVNFVHKIHMKFVIFDKLQKSSYELARIREGYTMNGMYCICVLMSALF